MVKRKDAPHEYSAEERERIVEHVCNEIVKKRSLFRILTEDEGMPSYAAFAKWQRESETIKEQVTHAREDALEAIIEETLEIADDEAGDPYIYTHGDGRKEARINGSHVKRAKLRIETRQKAAAMLAPRRFGTERVDLTSGGKPIDASTNVTLIENRVASILMLARRRIDQQEELKALIDVEATPSNA